MKTRAPALVRLLERPASERKIGPFWLVEERGAGGYAPVWLARERYGPIEVRLVAIKLFALNEFGPDKDEIIEEARALALVDHPHVARFYGIVVEESLEIMGLAMELLGGRSLESRLSTEKILSVDETLTIGIAIASALAAVHRAGIVHRDVKPGNIVEDSRGTCKLIDFGIATSSEDVEGVFAVSSSARSGANESEDVTAPVTGMATGTPGYIDPACAGQRLPPTPARDLYALGATLYRCLSGVLPAQVGAPKDGSVIWDGHVLSGKTAPRSLAHHRPDLPVALVLLVDKLLTPRPEMRPRGALQVEHELERIRLELGGRAGHLPPEDEGPFRGLQRFEARDRDVFFGRRDETSKALETLRGRGLVALAGASGSGKSSLARAALLPALIQGDLARWPKTWDVAIVEPGRDPWAAIVAALEPFIPEAPLLDPEPLVTAMEERANVEERGIVLFVDQLEEFVTTSLPESRDEAAELLARMGERAISGVRAMVALRSDLLDPLLGLGELGDVLSKSLCMVEPLRPFGWRESVTKALAAYGYEFEDEQLEGELFRGIEQAADAMPLVEFALAEMWATRDIEKKQLTRASFEKIGGIEGALELHAEATMNVVKETPELTMDIVRQVLLALTTPEGTRRARTEYELVLIAGEKSRDVLAILSRARLLVPAEVTLEAKDGGTEAKGQKSSLGVTVAHEALLTRWSRLQRWIADARADRVLAEELERDGARWKNDPESVGLWSGRRLGFARDLSQKNELRLSQNARHFVQASVRASQRRQAILTLVTTAVVVVLSLLGVKTVRADRELLIAERERAKAREVSLQTERELLEKIENILRSTKTDQEKVDEAQQIFENRKRGTPQVEVTSVVSSVATSKSLPYRGPNANGGSVRPVAVKTVRESVAAATSAQQPPPNEERVEAQVPLAKPSATSESGKGPPSEYE
jgi:eukaryotic-like serine/threonine-protein kinase